MSNVIVITLHNGNPEKRMEGPQNTQHTEKCEAQGFVLEIYDKQQLTFEIIFIPYSVLANKCLENIVFITLVNSQVGIPSTEYQILS